MEIAVNFVAVIVAAIVNFVIGMVWYSPMVFYKKWAKLMNLKESDMKKANMGMMFGLTFLGNLVLSYVLAHFLKLAMATDIISALQGALWVFIGFTIPFTLNSVLFERKPLEAYLINTGYYLVVLIAMAVIFAVMP